VPEGVDKDGKESKGNRNKFDKDRVEESDGRRRRNLVLRFGRTEQDKGNTARDENGSKNVVAKVETMNSD
jgi:hypothetical protein